MKAKNIRVSVYSKLDEVEELKGKLGELLPEEVPIVETVLPAETESGVFKQQLTELSAHVTKAGDTRELVEKIFSGLRPKDKKKLASEIGSRTDESGNFYVRLGKKEFLGGKLILREKDAIHVRIKVEAYPAKKSKAVESLREYFS